MIRAFIRGLAVLLTGCSYGPPNLAPILHGPQTGTSSMEILSMNSETAQSFRYKRPDQEESRDNRLEFLSFRMSMAGAISHRGLLIVPYLHNVILQPGLGLGIRGDRYYGLLAVEGIILKAGEFGLYSPRLGGQLGFRLARHLSLTYDYFHVTYSDYHATGFGWASWSDSEQSASKIGIAFGEGVFFVPSFSFIHGAKKFGIGLEAVAGLPGKF